METIKAKNIYYFYYINAIGGIETFYYYLAKKYYDKDLVIVYNHGDKKQLERLSKYFRCIKFNNQHFECEKAFFNFNTNIIDNVTAKEYILIIHGDYKAMVEQGQLSKANLPLHPKINKYVGVSKIACDSFYKLTGKKCELCYNPVMIDKPKRLLHLISATRLTKEKGKNRIIKMIELLNKNNIPYEWTIFTDDTNAIKDPHIKYMKPTLDIINYINDSDYLVQLSDNEGYCYSIVEALCCGVPVICTPCPVFKEIGLVDKKNCFYCDFNMDNVPIKEIYETKLQFDYTPKEDNWGSLLEDGPSQYQKDLQYKYLVRATNKYSALNCLDIELKRIPKVGDTWYTDYLRYEKLSKLGYVTLVSKELKSSI